MYYIFQSGKGQNAFLKAGREHSQGLDDGDLGRLGQAAEFENENDAHAWVRKNSGKWAPEHRVLAPNHKGKLVEVKDPRAGGEFNEAVDRYLG